MGMEQVIKFALVYKYAPKLKLNIHIELCPAKKSDGVWLLKQLHK